MGLTQFLMLLFDTTWEIVEAPTPSLGIGSSLVSYIEVVFLYFHFLMEQKYIFNITNWIFSSSNEIERILIPFFVYFVSLYI
jgi:hypothetical protein